MMPDLLKRFVIAGLIFFGVATSDLVWAQGIDEVVVRDLSGLTTGVVAALHHNGEMQFLEAFNSQTTPHVETGTLFAFPALTEVLLSATVNALHAAELLDADAPLSDVLPDLDPGIGAVTLRQLLTHTAGLDDAGRVEGDTWEATLDRIDDRALVAEPGLFYSRSRHSLPLASRVLSRVLQRPFDELASNVLLEPLGMTSSTFDVDEARRRGLVTGLEATRDREVPTRPVEAADTLNGLPVLFTTAEEALSFLSAWNEGRISGSSPLDVATTRTPTQASRRFGSGVWVDQYRGLDRAYRSSAGFGFSVEFHLVPASGAAVLVWARGRGATRTTRFLVDAVADATDAPPATRAPPPSDPDAINPPPDPARWSGTYRNGDLIFVLRASANGVLVLFDGANELGIEGRGGSRFHAVLPDGRVAVRFDLIEGSTGRRFLYFNNLVYRHGNDPMNQ